MASGYRLLFRSGDIELPPGEHLIGRGAECFVRIDQPMVSRKHARLVVGDEVYFEDLESRNGSLLNGRPVYGPRRLAPGDRLAIGTEEFVLGTCEPTGQFRKIEIGSSSQWDDRETSVDTHYQQLENLGEDLIQAGRIAEAEQLNRRALERLEHDMRGGYMPTAPILEEAMRRACRLAAVTKKASWLIWMFQFCGKVNLIPPAEIIDDLHHVLKQTPLDCRLALEAFLTLVIGRMSLNEETRFRLARIEQLKLLLP